jgi:hypothetical protein
MSLRKEKCFVVAIGLAGAGRGVNLRCQPAPVAEVVGPAGAEAVRRVTALAPFGREIEVGVIGTGGRSGGVIGGVSGGASDGVAGTPGGASGGWRPALSAGLRRLGRRLVRFLGRLGITLPLLAAGALFGLMAESPAMACGASVSRSAGLGTSVGGTVRDRDGEVLPGVSVCLTHVGLGVSRVMLSDGAGRYQFSSLSTGTYSLEAELEGYQTFSVTGIRLRRSEELRVDIALAELPNQPPMKPSAPKPGGGPGFRASSPGRV